MCGGHNAAGDRSSRNNKDRDQFGGNTGSGCPGSGTDGIRLADGSAGGLPLVRGSHTHLELTLDVVWAKSSGYSPALSVSHDGQGMRTIGKNAASSLVWKQKNYGRSGDGLVVLILHLDDWLPGGALTNVVDGAVAFHNDDIELAAGFLAPS